MFISRLPPRCLREFRSRVEGAYRFRRIHKTDGSSVDGFLEKDNSRGVTLRFMGGGSLFIPRSEIEGHPLALPDSAMPEGLIDNMPHDQVGNLLAYIRTLKLAKSLRA